MNKKLINRQNLIRRLQKLSVSFALLLLPIGAWAEDYDLWVGGVQVTSENAQDVLSGNEIGTISFNAATNTLTLSSINNVAFQSSDNPYIVNGLGNLTIYLDGDNYVWCSSTLLAESGDSAENYTVTFTTDEIDPGKLSIRTDTYNWYSGHTVAFDNGVGWHSSGTDHEFDTYEMEIGLVTYELTVGGEVVTSSNASNIFADDEVNDGKVSFDALTNTLTLNGAVIEGDIFSELFNSEWTALTINLTGDNSLLRILGNEEGSLAFTGTGTLSLDNGDGIIRDFSDVDFGDFNLLSNSAPGVHWDEEQMSLVNYDGDAVGNLTLTTATVYPLWVFDEGGYRQVTADNRTNVLGDDYSSVSYDGNGTLTVKGAQIASMDYASFVVGEDIEALTVHLVGYNEIGGGDGQYAFKFIGESTTLTFTTSETLPGFMIYNGNLADGLSGDIIYQNGLVNNYSMVYVPSTENTNVSYITGRTSVINPQGGAFYMYTNGSVNMASNVELVSLDNHAPTYVKLKTPENGAMDAGLWPSQLNSPFLLYKVTLQFDWGTCANKNVTVQIRGIDQEWDESTGDYIIQADGKTYSEAIALTTADADGIIEIPLTSVVTSENVQVYFSSSEAFSLVPLTVALTSAQSYNIEVAGVLVSELNAEDVLGDGKVSYDDETNTLTLNNASITLTLDDGERPAIDYSGTADLTISLIGTNTIQAMSGCETIRYNGDDSSYPTLIFAKGDSQPCSLQLEAGEETSVISTGFEQIDGVNGIGNATGNDLALISEVPVMYEYQLNGLCTIGANQTSFPVTSALIKAIYNIGVTFGEHHWATYCAPANLAVPDDMEAYIVKGVSGTVVTVQNVDYLPQGMGVLLYKEELVQTDVENYTTYGYEGQTATITGNMLVAASEATSVSGITTATTNIYVLYDDYFVKATSGTIPAGRCFLPVSVGTVPDVGAGSRLTIRFDDTVSGISTTLNDNGEMTNDNAVYDLQGRKVSEFGFRNSELNKGLYIIHGKKAIISK